jgi:hypothetical protein
MRNLLLWSWMLLLSRECVASECDDRSLKALYQSQQLFELRHAVNKGGAPVFYQGIVACAFNDLRQCERKLESVIKSAPNSTDVRHPWENGESSDYPLFWRSGILVGDRTVNSYSVLRIIRK